MKIKIDCGSTEVIVDNVKFVYNLDYPDRTLDNGMEYCSLHHTTYCTPCAVAVSKVGHQT